MTGTDTLAAALRDLAADQPPQPNRAGAVLRAHRRQRRRQQAAALAAAGLTAVGAILALQLPGGGSPDLVVTPAAPAWDSRYIPWQAVDSALKPGQADRAVQTAWNTWAGTTGAPGDTVKTIAVSAPGVGPGTVVFQALDAAGALRLVSAAWTGSGAAAVIDDIPAPAPSTVRALAVVAQTENGVLRNLADPATRASATETTATTLAMFVPPSTADPRIRFTADGATTAAGITTGEFGADGVLAHGLGDAGRGPVPAQSVQVTIRDGGTVLYDRGPWLMP